MADIHYVCKLLIIKVSPDLKAICKFCENRQQLFSDYHDSDMISFLTAMVVTFIENYSLVIGKIETEIV